MEVFWLTANTFKEWLKEVDTDPILINYIVEYVKGRGNIKMSNAVCGLPQRFH